MCPDTLNPNGKPITHNAPPHGGTLFEWARLLQEGFTINKFAVKLSRGAGGFASFPLRPLRGLSPFTPLALSQGNTRSEAEGFAPQYGGKEVTLNPVCLRNESPQARVIKNTHRDKYL